MKIIIPTIFLHFAETAFGKENIAPFKTLPPLGQATTKSRYIIYQENGDVFEPVLENISLNPILVTTDSDGPYPLLISIKEFESDPEPVNMWRLKSHNRFKEDIYHERTFNILSEQLISVIETLQSYSRLTNMSIPDTKMSHAYLYKDIIITPLIINKEHNSLQAVTAIKIEDKKYDQSHYKKVNLLKNILQQLGAQEGKDEYGFNIMYLPFPMYDFEKIKKEYSFTKHDIRNLLSKSRVQFFKKFLALIEDNNKEVVIESQYNVKETYNDISKVAENISLSYTCHKQEKEYAISFNIEFPFLGDRKIREFFYSINSSLSLEETIRKVKDLEKIRNYIEVEHRDRYTHFYITYGYHKHELRTYAIVTEEIKKDLDLDLSLQIIQALCSIDVNRTNTELIIDTETLNKKMPKLLKKKQQTSMNTLF